MEMPWLLAVLNGGRERAAEVRHEDKCSCSCNDPAGLTLSIPR